MNNFDKDKSKALDLFSNELENIKNNDKKLRKTLLSDRIQEVEKSKKVKNLNSRAIQMKISKLKTEVGLSPFIYDKKLKNARLSRKKFIKSLAIELLEIGLKSGQGHSGLFSLSSLHKLVNKKGKDWQIKTVEIIESLTFLQEKGLISSLKENQNDIFVFFKPIELDKRLTKLLITIAGLINLNIEKISALLGWKKRRSRRCYC